jgi:FkbM family methyltransferase
MLTFDTIYGTIETPDWPDDLILRSLAAYGEWGYCEQMVFASLLAEGDRVWDGGAFLGTFGLGAAQRAATAERPLAKLVAFEPGPALTPCVQSNLAANAPCPFEVSPFGISLVPGNLRAKVAASNGDQTPLENHGAVAYEMTDATADVTIQCKPLWQLRQTHGDYDVIKLDLEGMEFDAIRGDFDYMKERKPVIWAECNEDFASLRVLEAMRALGYAPLYIAFPAFRRANFKANENLIFPMAYEAVLLAAPQERLDALQTSAVGEDVIVKPVSTSWELRQAIWTTPRWSLPEWTEMTRAELIARLGRYARAEKLEEFLNDAL